MTPFERSLSKFSENQKNFEIGSTEFKLRQQKDMCLYLERVSLPRPVLAPPLPPPPRPSS